MKCKFWLALICLIPLLIGGCQTGAKTQPTPTPMPTSVVPEKPTYVVQRGTVEKKVQFTARISPINEKDLFFKNGGYVSKVYVSKGDWVEVGTILAELEIDAILNQLSLAELDLQGVQKAYNAAMESNERTIFNAQLNLDVLKLRMERLKLQAPLVDFTSLKLSKERAAESLNEAKAAYKSALDRPWEPQAVRDGLYKNITSAQRAYDEIEARYNFEVLQYSRSQQLHALDLQLMEKDILRAEQELAWLQRGVDPALTQQVEAAQIKVNRIKVELENSQLIAPFSGEITSITATPGKAVEARKPVAVIADPNIVDITADVPTNQMDLLQEGMEAEVTSSRAPGQVFKAIIQTMPYPYGTGGGSVKVEDMDKRTHIVLVNPEELELRVGDLVKVTVLVERSEDTLFLPPAAIRTFEGRKFVMVRVGERLQKVDVKLGVQGEDYVEILQGLEEGQIIEGL